MIIATEAQINNFFFESVGSVLYRTFLYSSFRDWKFAEEMFIQPNFRQTEAIFYHGRRDMFIQLHLSFHSYGPLKAEYFH